MTNVGADTGEFVEVADLEGTSITPYKVYYYNGDGGGVITNKALTTGTCVNGICLHICECWVAEWT